MRSIRLMVRHVQTIQNHTNRLKKRQRRNGIPRQKRKIHIQQPTKINKKILRRPRTGNVQSTPNHIPKRISNKQPPIRTRHPTIKLQQPQHNRRS